MRNRVINLANLQQFTAINVLSDPGVIGGPKIVPLGMQVVLNWQLADGKIAHNVLCGVSPTTPAPTVAMADAIFAALGTGAAWTTLASDMATTSLFTGVSLRRIDIRDQPFVNSTGAAKPGTGGAIAMPNEMAIVITLRTAKVGPANRGRIYIPGHVNTAVLGTNIIPPTVVTNLQGWANTLIGTLSAQTLTLSIAQPARAAYTGVSGTDHPARAATSTPVTSVSVRNNTWDSQRRRGLK